MLSGLSIRCCLAAEAAVLKGGLGVGQVCLTGWVCDLLRRTKKNPKGICTLKTEHFGELVLHRSETAAFYSHRY